MRRPLHHSLLLGLFALTSAAEIWVSSVQRLTIRDGCKRCLGHMEKKVEKEYCWYPNDNFIAYLVYFEANEFSDFLWQSSRLSRLKLLSLENLVQLESNSPL